MRKQKSQKKFSAVKKTIKSFMQDEDGFVTKDNIMKIGLGTVASIGVLSSVYATVTISPSNAIVVNTSFTEHKNELGVQGVSAGAQCWRMAHTNVDNYHMSHSSTSMTIAGTVCKDGSCDAIQYP